jgi:hypothetical protein
VTKWAGRALNLTVVVSGRASMNAERGSFGLQAMTPNIPFLTDGGGIIQPGGGVD